MAIPKVSISDNRPTYPDDQNQQILDINPIDQVFVIDENMNNNQTNVQDLIKKTHIKDSVFLKML